VTSSEEYSDDMGEKRRKVEGGGREGVEVLSSKLSVLRPERRRERSDFLQSRFQRAVGILTRVWWSFGIFPSSLPWPFKARRRNEVNSERGELDRFTVDVHFPSHLPTPPSPRWTLNASLRRSPSF